MELTELQPRHHEAIRRFVNSEEFLEIKDAFISHTPEGSADGSRHDDPAKNLGKFLGTRYVFNRLEMIARNKHKEEESKKAAGNRARSSGKDPDLDS